MEDLRTIVGMFNSVMPALSRTEEEDLKKVMEMLNKQTLKRFPDRPEKDFVPIEKPGELPDPDPIESKMTWVTDTRLYVGENGDYRTIGEAVSDAPDNSTIIVMEGTYSESFEALGSLHIVAEGTVRLDQPHIIVSGSCFTMKGFEFRSVNNEMFTLNGGTFALDDCQIQSQSEWAEGPVFGITGPVKIELNNCQIVSEKVLDVLIGCEINIFGCSISGPILASRCRMQFNASQLSGCRGKTYTLDLTECDVVIEQCTFNSAKDVALIARNRTIIRMKDTDMKDIDGAGIWVYGLSEMNGQNLRFSGCTKAPVILANAKVILTGSSITNSSYTGCEVTSGTLELIDSWISDTQASAVLCDSKAKARIVNCRIMKSQSYGIEARNGSEITCEKTMVDDCDVAGIHIRNSKFNGVNSQFSENKEANVVCGDKSMIHLRGCIVKRSTGDGLYADSESIVTCESSYIIENGGQGVLVQQCRNVKFTECIIFRNLRGGLLCESSKWVRIDESRIKMNSVVMQDVGSAVIRKSMFIRCLSRSGQMYANHIEFKHKSEAVFEENKLLNSTIRIKNSTLAIRKCNWRNDGVKAPYSGIIADSFGTVTAESNTWNKVRLPITIRDNSSLTLFCDTFRVVGNAMYDCPQEEWPPLAMEQKVYGVSLRAFSVGRIEGNTIDGGYDFAIHIDGRSSADCRANSIKCGEFGGICYAGASSGLCEGNHYEGGADPDYNEQYQHGCIRKLRAGT